MRKILVISILIFFSALSFSMAEDLTPGKKDDINKLLEMTGALKLGKQMSETFVKQMSQALKSSRPDIPEKMYKILEEEVNSVIDEQMLANGGFLEMITLIYHKYYSQEDLKGLLSFYETDLGKKVIKVTPQITQESMRAGQVWGQALVPLLQERLIKRFKEEGVDLTTT